MLVFIIPAKGKNPLICFSDSIILSSFPTPHRLVIIKIIIFLSSGLKYIEIEFLVKIYHISLLKDLIAEIQVGAFTTVCSK